MNGKKPGRLERKLYVHSEMVAAGVWANIKRPDMLDELFVNCKRDGETVFEFGIELTLLQQNKGAMVTRIYSDTWNAFTEDPKLFKLLAKFTMPSDRDDRETWPKLIEALEEAGWKKEKPEPREMPKPLVCEKCGRP